MRSRLLSTEDIRKFRVEPVEGGTRLDRYWQNQGRVCRGCRSELSLEEVLPAVEPEVEDRVEAAAG